MAEQDLAGHTWSLWWPGHLNCWSLLSTFDNLMQICLLLGTCKAQVQALVMSCFHIDLFLPSFRNPLFENQLRNVSEKLKRKSISNSANCLLIE